MGDVLGLARWEWFKLRPRWMPWVLLAILTLFSQLSVWGAFFSYRSLENSGGEVPYSLDGQNGPRRLRLVSCNDLRAGRLPEPLLGADATVIEGLLQLCRRTEAGLGEQLGSLRASFTVPGSIPHALQSTQMLGLVLLGILAASAIGMEYGLGALRQVLARGTGRWQFLAAKLLVLSVAAGCALGIVAAAAVASGLVAGVLEPATAGWVPPVGGWVDAGVSLGRAWSSLLPYLALTGLAAVATRSSAGGMAVGLGYYFGEQIAVALFSSIFDWFSKVAEYLPGQNIAAWSGGFSFAMGDGNGIGDLHAILVLAGYTVVLGGMAFWLFHRRDVTGANGG